MSGKMYKNNDKKKTPFARKKSSKKTSTGPSAGLAPVKLIDGVPHVLAVVQRNWKPVKKTWVYKLSPLKGKHEGSETPPETACREFNEEACGVARSISPVELTGFRAKETYVPTSKMYIYSFLAGDDTVAPDLSKFQPTNKIVGVKWVSLFKTDYDQTCREIGHGCEPEFTFTNVCSQLQRLYSYNS
jgi:hypothetical protein